MNKLMQRGFVNALGAAIYIILIALFLQNANFLFGQKDTILAPITALMLLVLSATITGSLVLGKPVSMYLEGNKAEAVKLFFYTLISLAVLTLLTIIISIIYHQVHG